MHATDPLVATILDAIRLVCGEEMLVQFVTGHSHLRQYEQLEDFSSTFEAGKYSDTVVFASMSFEEDGSVAFDHRFIGGNVESLKAALGECPDGFSTPAERSYRC